MKKIISWLLLTQIALLVVHYGFDKILPWWVLWLPALIMGIIIFFVFIIVIVVLITFPKCIY